jgi:hypothetical protein
MGLGYALTEQFTVHNGAPAVTLGTLGLLRSTQVPEIDCRIIEKNPATLAYGAKGVGEIVMVATAPAVACAYFQRDGKMRRILPLEGTPYSRREHGRTQSVEDSRGRDTDFSVPPAQIRTGGFPASGSYLR